MTDHPDVGSKSLAERVTLIGLADLSDRGETAVHSFEVKEACLDCLESMDDEALGQLSEKEIVRALNRLETTELVVQTDGERESTVGKGRPTYELGIEPAAVFESLADDDGTGEIVRAVQDG